jgi:hypothetical protein
MLLAVSTAPGSVDAMCASDMAKATARRQLSGSDGPTTVKHQCAPIYRCITPGPCLGMHVPSSAWRAYTTWPQSPAKAISPNTGFSHRLCPRTPPQARLRAEAEPLQSGGSAASHSPSHSRLAADSRHSPWRSGARPAKQNAAPGSASHSAPAAPTGSD